MVHPGKEASVLIKQSPIYLQDDNGMLGGVLIQQVLEVGGAGAQDHLVGFGMLPLEDFIKLDEGDLFLPYIFELFVGDLDVRQ